MRLFTRSDLDFFLLGGWIRIQIWGFLTCISGSATVAKKSLAVLLTWIAFVMCKLCAHEVLSIFIKQFALYDGQHFMKILYIRIDIQLKCKEPNHDIKIIGLHKSNKSTINFHFNFKYTGHSLLLKSVYYLLILMLLSVILIHFFS